MFHFYPHLEFFFFLHVNFFHTIMSPFTPSPQGCKEKLNYRHSFLKQFSMWCGDRWRDGQAERGCRDLVPVLLWLVVWPAVLGVDDVCENIHKHWLTGEGRAVPMASLNVSGWLNLRITWAMLSS